MKTSLHTHKARLSPIGMAFARWHGFGMLWPFLRVLYAGSGWACWDAEMDKTPPPAPWAHLLTEFLTHLAARGYSPQTIDSRRQQLSRFARAMDPLTPATVAEKDVEAYFAAQAWSRETGRSAQSALRSFFSWSVKCGHRPDQPMQLPPIKASRPAPRPAAVPDVLDAIQRSHPRTSLMIRLGVELGIRRGEIAKIHVGRDLLRQWDGTWSLVVHGKGAQNRIMPLPNQLTEAIWNFNRDAGGYLFPGQIDGHLSARRVGELVSEALPPGVTCHMLRHAFATQITDMYSDILMTQNLLGHTSPATTIRYVQPNTSAAKAAVGGIAEFWDKARTTPGHIFQR